MPGIRLWHVEKCVAITHTVEEMVHEMFPVDAAGSHLISVNEPPETMRVSVDVPGADSTAILEAVTGAGKLAVTGGKVTMEFGPYEVKYFHWR